MNERTTSCHRMQKVTQRDLKIFASLMYASAMISGIYISGWFCGLLVFIGAVAGVLIAVATGDE